MIIEIRSYSALNASNKIYESEVKKLTRKQLIKKTIFLDFSLALSKKKKALTIIREDKNRHIAFFQSTHSIHNRVDPYIAYIMKDKKLYRLESLREFTEYPLSAESEFTADFLGDVKSFVVYEPTDQEKKIVLVHILFEKESEIILKIKMLNV